MSPELGMQLMDIGLKTIDGLGNMWADKINRKEKAEKLKEINDLREAYAERINGPGSGGGTAAGHLGEVDYLNYFIPALQSAATTGYYQLANHVGNKAYENYLKNRQPVSEEDKPPVPTGDAKPEDLGQTIADTPEVKVVPNDNQGWFQALGMYPTSSPVGKTSQTSYVAGMDPELMKLFGKKFLNSDEIPQVKKGMKLIPKQK